MLGANDTNVIHAFRTALGRRPTKDELLQWTNYDFSKVPDTAGKDSGQVILNTLNQSPEAQQYKSTGTPSDLSKSAVNKTVDLGTQNPTAFSQSTPMASPTYAQQYSPAQATGYQPTVDQFGNVSPYIPQGSQYTPGQYANYVPSGAIPEGRAMVPTSGGLTQAVSQVPATQSVAASQGISPFAYPNTGDQLGTVSMGGGQTASGGAFPSFNFNFGQEQANAYQSLAPYYQKLISFAGGDLDLAKRMLENNYQSGSQQAQGDYGQAMGQFNITAPQEREQLQTTQNQRGIMTSGFGNTERNRMQESQGLRREAIERALQQRQTQLSSDRGFGMEQQQRGFEKIQFDQERQKQQEASGIAQNKFTIGQTQYANAVDNTTRAEQNKAQQAANDAQTKFYSGGQ